MLFSSLIFLYAFLPLTLLGYYITPYAFKNYWLLLTSLIFFAWGGVSYTIILIASITFNYFYGKAIEKHLGTRKARRWLIAGVSTNLLLLIVFKYTDFFIYNLNGLFSIFSMPPVDETGIVLPVGISFYTFHALSYLVDIYRGKTHAQRNIFNLALYISMFSQLIAGPIIRYSDVWQQLKERQHSLIKFSSGIERFLIGLGKKVLLANVFARVADAIFTTSAAELNATSAWLGIGCYTLQIYYDFAGYSDMAIGLGRMFGFEFMENFNFPYIARSVKEFWRRWHISLSSFFRDYVYIPLGGNKKGTGRTYINLLIVFFLTGFWHGASWSFVVWGLFHGLFMVIERLGFEKLLEKAWQPLANLYTLLVVMFAWVLFRADTLNYALNYWAAMFRFNGDVQQLSTVIGLMNNELFLALAVGLLGAFGFFPWLAGIVQRKVNSGNPVTVSLVYGYNVCSSLFYAALLVLCSLYLIAGTYNPFIYYRF